MLSVAEIPDRWNPVLLVPSAIDHADSDDLDRVFTDAYIDSSRARWHGRYPKIKQWLSQVLETSRYMRTCWATSRSVSTAIPAPSRVICFNP